MITRRAVADLPASTCCHTVRATGITAYLSNGGTLEHAAADRRAPPPSDAVPVSSERARTGNMTPTPTRPILMFRPLATWARTILYEYYCMSWATRIAAEGTTHPPLAARLVGESFELAVKVLHILSQGPERKLKFGHSLGGLIRHMQPLERLLRNLWGGRSRLPDRYIGRRVQSLPGSLWCRRRKVEQAEPNNPERLRGNLRRLDLNHAHAVRGVDVLVGTGDLVELSEGATGTVTPWGDVSR